MVSVLDPILQIERCKTEPSHGMFVFTYIKPVYSHLPTKIVFAGKTIYSHRASLCPGVYMYMYTCKWVPVFNNCQPTGNLTKMVGWGWGIRGGEGTRLYLHVVASRYRNQKTLAFPPFQTLNLVLSLSTATCIQELNIRNKRILYN